MQGSRGVGFAIVAPVALAAATLASPAAAGPPPTDITVADDFFSPDREAQILESSTSWNWDDSVLDEHNVRQDDKLFYSGEETSDPNASFTTKLASGTYRYHCEVHGNGVMDGVVTVEPLVGPPASDLESFRMTWGDPLVAKPSRYDVKYRVDNGRWKDWIKDKTAVSREFGKNDKPVDVDTGKLYAFRARTELRNNPNRASGFSPVVENMLNR
jgi:hypothetical protein